jgi:uncharacterized protein with HEPN domain
MKKDDFVFIEHMLNEIVKIENSIIDISKNQFEDYINLRDATERRLEIIGEAAKNISFEFKQKYNKIE